MRRNILLLCLWLGLLLPGLSQDHHSHDFSSIDRWIERFEDPAREEWQRPDMVVELLGLRPGQNVADIGAGTGYFTRRLAKKVSPGGFAVAVEIEPGFFPYIQKRAREASQANILTQPAEPNNPWLAPQAFDLIFLCNTLHHIDHRAEYYAWLRRALRPEGRVVVVDFFKDMDIPVGPRPEMRLAPGALRMELEAAGFSVSVDAESLPYQYILTARPRS